MTERKRKALAFGLTALFFLVVVVLSTAFACLGQRAKVIKTPPKHKDSDGIVVPPIEECKTKCYFRFIFMENPDDGEYDDVQRVMTCLARCDDIFERKPPVYGVYRPRDVEPWPTIIAQKDDKREWAEWEKADRGCGCALIY